MHLLLTENLSDFQSSSSMNSSRSWSSKAWNDNKIVSRGVPNSSFRLFGRIRIASAAEHFDVAPAVLIFTTSVNSFGCLYDRCLLSMLPSHDPLPFIRLIVSQNLAVWTRAAGTDWVKSAVDVTSCTIHVQTNYSYSFWRHYLSEYEYTIRTTIRRRHRSEYEANIWYIPNNQKSS